MAENQEPGKEIKNDKNAKPRFNSNWVFAILVLAVFGFQLLFAGKATQKAGQREIEQMIINHDIEKVIVVNKDRAEIYLKPEAIKSGRYPDIAAQKSFGFQPQKPQFYHTFGTVELFEQFFSSIQTKAGYTEDQWILPGKTTLAPS
jgi:AFG3 family protein